MAVRFTRYWRGGYWPGDVAGFDEATERRIIENGAGEPVTERSGALHAPVVKPASAPKRRGRPPKVRA